MVDQEKDYTTKDKRMMHSRAREKLHQALMSTNKNCPVTKLNLAYNEIELGTRELAKEKENARREKKNWIVNARMVIKCFRRKGLFGWAWTPKFCSLFALAKRLVIRTNLDSPPPFLFGE
jgi:hypothetical protein